MSKQTKQDKVQNTLATVSLLGVVAMLAIGFTSPDLQTPATVSAVVAGSSGAVSAILGILH